MGVQSPAFTTLLCNSRGGSILLMQEDPDVIGKLLSTNNAMIAQRSRALTGFPEDQVLVLSTVWIGNQVPVVLASRNPKSFSGFIGHLQKCGLISQRYVYINKIYL